MSGPQSKQLDGYETVKERKKRFYSKYEDGRIVVEMIAGDHEWAQFKASVFKSADDQKSSLPLATGFAQEFKGVGGFANQDSWLENCEESAIGRALDNAGFSGNNLCSREEMEKVARAHASQSPEQSTRPRLSQIRMRQAQECCGQPMSKSRFKKDGLTMVWCKQCKRSEPMEIA